MEDKKGIFLKSILFSILIPLTLLSCGPKSLYLVEDIEAEIEHDILYKCLNKAISLSESGAPELTNSERTLLRGVSTKDFLRWDSLSGPKPVVNPRGLPSEAKSLFPSTSASEDISDRYVLCLLLNGYQWPNY